jgi:hypothetical protein
VRHRMLRAAAILSCAVLLGATVGLAGCGSQAVDQPSIPRSDTIGPRVTTTSTSTSATAVSTTGTPERATSIEYRNADYGFTFSLPESFDGYSIVTQQWEGFPNHTNGAGSGDAPVYGPLILIRHPQWTRSNPRQDIPIMVFTLAEWDQAQQAELSVGAAPIPPSELGRNATYVFALPARYNYAFPTGYEEVAKILEGHPLYGTEAAPPASTFAPALSTIYDITEADSGQIFTYTVTSRFSVILDATRYSPDHLSVVPTGVIGDISNVPDVDPPLQATRYEGVNPGTCTIRNGDFVVTVRIVPLTQ